MKICSFGIEIFSTLDDAVCFFICQYSFSVVLNKSGPDYPIITEEFNESFQKPHFKLDIES